MFNLFIKDYLFTKKIILITLLYCVAVPIILIMDNDGKYFFADLLLPLAMITAPLAKIMNIEDTKSAIIFRKTLPYSSFEGVGARFIFVLSLLLESDILLCIMKKFIFKTSGFFEAMLETIPIFSCFAVYYALYMAVYYWKGYFASQFCIYVLIIIICFGRNLLNENIQNGLLNILNERLIVLAVALVIYFLIYLVCCRLEENKRI